MKYMLFFWIIFLIIIILAIVRHFPKGNTIRRNLDISMILLLIMAFSFLVVAIVTGDPLFQKFGIPQEYEWVVGIFLVGLTSWKLYFNPLKERVITVESKISSLETGVKAGFSSVKEDLTLIKDKLLKK